MANKKTVTIQPGGGEKELSVLLATTKSKKLNKPSDMLHKYVMKKNFRRMSKIVESQVSDNKYRPDLKKAALARLSYVYQSLLAAKNGIRKQ
ncbi:60S ribosomal protein L28, partial [Streptomyces fildesensis]|uniref:60S ribosomal protein L28 n=1 Tax=Streptomyces fildesensis TaxID=375757 RepID=UPI001E645B1A